MFCSGSQKEFKQSRQKEILTKTRPDDVNSQQHWPTVITLWGRKMLGYIKPVSDGLHKNQTLLSNLLIESIQIPVDIKTEDYYIVWIVYILNGADGCFYS